MKTISRIEFIVGAVLVLIFMVWAFDKCSSTRAQSQPDTPTPTEQPAQDPTPAQPTTPATTTTTVTQTPQPTTPTPAPAQSTTTVVARQSVYITVDSLNMRDKPFLNSNIMARLPRGTEVYFVNEVTEFTQKITMDGKSYEEPWVKVETQSGTQGWLYGGGVRFYALQ